MNLFRVLRSFRDPVVWGLLLPPVVFLGWTVLGPNTLGNDYLHYNVRVPQTLRFYTGESLEPMWYPHQTGGIPVGGLFYGQYFHLPAWISSRVPAFWRGDALRVLAARHLLLFGLAQAVYYVALRRAAGLERGASWLVSLVLVYNLRTLDAFRYGIALDAAVYTQAALLLSMLHLLQPSRWRLALIALITQLLFTCGYPVLLPFALLVALFALPALVRVVGARALVRRGSQALLAALAGVLLAAPHWLAISEWMAVNDTRVARPSLEWAGEWAMAPPDLLTNLFFPWEAEVHSSYGGSTLLAALLIAVVLALLRARGWPLLLALAFPFVYALGRLTPVFPFFFSHVPGFTTLRGPGRAVYMLPVLLLVALLWLRGREGRLPFLQSSTRIAALAMAVASALGLLRVLVAPPAALPPYSPAVLTGWWTPAPQAVWLALGVVAGLALFRGAAARSPLTAGALALATAAQIGMMMRHGTWIAEREPSPDRAAFQAVNHLPLYASFPLLATNELRKKAEGSATVAYARFLRRAAGQANCFLPIDPDHGRGVVLPFYLSDRLECVDTGEAALARLRTDEDCLATGRLRTLVVGPDCGPSPAGPDGLVPLNERNRILALTPNVTTLDVDTLRESVLVTPFPEATANWEGWLDGNRVPLVSVNAGFLGVRVPAGRHQVSVRYFSRRLVLGYRIAFGTAIFLAGAAALTFLAPWLGNRRAWVVASIALIGLSGLALVAYRSWEHRFAERARRETVMNHDYPVLLQEQLTRWRAAGQ